MSEKKGRRKLVRALWGLCAAAAAAGYVDAAAFSDRQGPEIANLCFSTEAGEVWEETAQADAGKSESGYRYFSDGAVTVSADIYDPEPSSGLGSAVWRLLPADSAGGTEEQVLEEPLGGTASETAVFTIPADFKGWLQAEAADRVGNRSAAGMKIGLVLETEELHSREEHLSVVRTEPGTEAETKAEKEQMAAETESERAEPETDAETEPGRKNTLLELKVSDSVSGIAEVVWQVGDGSGRAEIGVSGEIFGDGAEEWEVTGRDANLVTGLLRSWPLDAADEVFVHVRMTDRAGNSSEWAGTFAGIQEPVTKETDVTENSLEALRGRYVREAGAVWLTHPAESASGGATGRIEVICNGDPAELKPGRDYRAEWENGSGNGSGKSSGGNDKNEGGGVYRYVMNAAVFEREGIYQIRSSAAPTVSFCVDRTAPVILPLMQEEEGMYREISGSAVFRIADNLLLKKVEFYLDGCPAEAAEEQGIWRLPVASGGDVRQVAVRAEDEAGNWSELTVKCSAVSV